MLDDRTSLGEESAADRPAASPEELGLTEQQIKVLALMMQGKTNKDICRWLGLAVPTVKYHVSAVLKALHAAIALKRRLPGANWGGTCREV